MSALAISADELKWNPAEGMARYARARQTVHKPETIPEPAPVRSKPAAPIPAAKPKPVMILPAAIMNLGKWPHFLACKRYPSPICGPCQPHHVAFSFYQYEETVSPVVVATIEDCIRYACKTYGFTRPELIGPQRHKSLVQARHVAMYLAKKYAAKSLPEIGRRLGDRDHTTVLHGVKRITRDISAGTWSLPSIDEVRNA